MRKPRHQKAEQRMELAAMASAMAGQLKAPFRGEIWEFFATTPMGRGYANAGAAFDIETAYYLKPVLLHIRRTPYGKTVLMAAVQTLKTMVIEMSAGFFIANDPGDMTIYFTGDESALDQAKARTMPFIRAQQDIARMVGGVMSAGPNGRFDINTDEMFLPGMVLRMWPLNESSTQRLSLRYVFVSDAYLSKRTGLIQQSVARVTQHDTAVLRDYKIILESQGGEEGDDFDVQWQSTTQSLLHVACPTCRVSQPFEWLRTRPPDFIPAIPLSVPSLDRDAWLNHHTPLLRSKERRYCGMQRGDGAKREEGGYDDQAVLRDTHYECYHCGALWRDLPETRRIIDHSSTFEPTNPKVDTKDAGFWWPAWCGQRISWGKIMLEYLEAKKSSASGNFENLKIWHQKREARPWSNRLSRPVIELAAASYDPAEAIPNEVARNMMTDVQQDQAHKEATGISIPGWFWVVIRAVDNAGNSRQLWRGHVKGWDKLIELQKRFKVLNERHMLDVGHWPEQIMLKAAAEASTVKIEKPAPPFFIKERITTWLLLAGSDKAGAAWKHPDGRFRPWSPPQTISIPLVDSSGRRKLIILKKITWSNVAFKMQLDALRSGAEGMPKFEILARNQLEPAVQEMETGNRTYENQMAGEVYRQDKGKDGYDPVHPDVHYRDCECMGLVRQAIDGQLGHVSVVGG